MMRFFVSLKLPAGLEHQWRTTVLPRYQALQARERVLLLTALIGLPVAVFVFAFWLPLLDDVRDARAALVDIKREHAEAELLAERLVTIGPTTVEKQELLGLAERLAREAGIRQYVLRLKPEPALAGSQRLQVRMQGVPYKGLVSFLGKLAEGGVQLSRARLQADEQDGVLDVELLAIQPATR